MTWELIREDGIEYASLPETRRRQQLCLPSYAAQAADGTYVIAEERNIEKQVPFRFECRTLRVDANHQILFDSEAIGIDDGFGCLMDDGCIAIVRRTQWELLIISPQGSIIDRLGLHACSKKLPRYARWTDKGTFLVVFFNRSYEVDIVELDRQGRLLWFLPPGVRSIGIPSSVQLLASDSILVADSFRHFATEIERDGNISWQFGEPENPSSHERRVSSPNSATCLANGQRLLADTRNHRILSVSPDGHAQTITLPDSGLCDPTYADGLPNGDCLVCDAGNGRIVQLDPEGKIIWEYGDSIAERRHLSYPRSVDLVGPNRYLVADTGNNRIIEFHDGKVEARRFGDGFDLFWPRCVRLLPSGALLIADARNGRIVEISPNGHVVNMLRNIQSNLRPALEDPHDVWLLPNGHLLISDSSQDLVIEVDWSGTVHRIIGDSDDVRLKDPHSAQQMNDGSVLIADTGNHRILIVGTDGKILRSLSEVKHQAAVLRLHHPRYAEVGEDGTLVITDTGQNRILGCTIKGELLWEFSRAPGSKLPYLDQPRWAKLVNPDEIVVCDHFHHRILHVRWLQGRQATN
jgi:hypothetical protein